MFLRLGNNYRLLNISQAYLILNLKPDATQNDVKQAYRKMVLESHPDKNTSEQDGKKFKLITEAYHTVRNNLKEGGKNSSQKPTSDFNQEKSSSAKRWGAQKSGKTPEADWGKFTKEVEDADPQFWQQYTDEFWKNYEARKSRNTKSKYDFEITQEKPPNLFTMVDHSLCIACSSCETIAPEVFQIDKNSKMNPKSNVIKQNAASKEKIMNAAQTCPTKAIRVEDKETNSRLYPH